MTDKTKYSNTMKYTLIISSIIFVLFLSNVITYTIGIKNVQKNSQAGIEAIIKNIKIENNKNKKYSIIIEPSDEKILNADLQKNYTDFLIQYNENQAQWLNVWLTIMAIALAFIGLIAPICFMKLYEDKKNEMDKIINNAKEQQKQTKVNVEEMAKKIDIVEEKSQKMTNDLKEVKGYVDEAKATAKYTEALNKVQEEENYKEAKNILQEAINLKPDYDAAYSLLSTVYFNKNKYDLAEENINKAIAIEPKAHYYNKLAIYLHYQKKYADAIKNIDIAIDKKPEEALFYARKANICSYQKDIDGTTINIDKALKISNDAWVMELCGLSALTIGQSQKAVDYIEQALNKNKSASCYYNLSEAYIFNAQIDKSIETIKTYIIKQDKNMSGIYNDDYDKWMDKITSLEQNTQTEELINIINTLEKKPRENE